MEEVLVTRYLVLYHNTFTAEFEDASFGLPVHATVFSNIFLINISNSPELSKNPRSLKIFIIMVYLAYDQVSSPTMLDLELWR